METAQVRDIGLAEQATQLKGKPMVGRARMPLLRDARRALRRILINPVSAYLGCGTAVALLLAGAADLRQEAEFRRDQHEISRSIRATQIAAVGILTRAKDAEIAVLGASLGNQEGQRARLENWNASRTLVQAYRGVLQLARGLGPAEASLARQAAEAADRLIVTAEGYLQDWSRGEPLPADAGERIGAASGEMRAVSSETVAAIQAYHDGFQEEASRHGNDMLVRALGLVVGALGALVVVAVGWRARTRETEESLRLAYETAQLFPLTWRARDRGALRVPRASSGLLRRLGITGSLTREVLIGTAASSDRQKLTDAIAQADAGQPVDTVIEFGSDADGNGTFLKIVLRRKGFSGARGIMTGFVQDVTGEVRGLRARDLAMRESKHRMANLIHLVRGVASRTVRRHGTDPQTFLSVLDGRLNAIMRAQTLLLQEGRSSSLRDAVGSALEGWEDEMGERCTLVDDSIMVGGEGAGEASPESIRPGSAWTAPLSGEQAKAVVLVVHELAMNATKYGSFSCREGSLAISALWHEGAVLMRWTETGGPAPAEKRVPGYGSRLLSALTHDLGTGGSIRTEFREAGLHAEIRILPKDSMQDPVGVPSGLA